MNYLYDILLNFNSKLYEVFEWEKTDAITHIRKIPFFKVKSENLYEILNNKVEFDLEFLSGLYKRCEYFSKNKINNLDYCFLVTDGKEVVALKCNNKIIIGYSKLLYEEEIEALEYSDGIKYSNLDYKIIHKYDVDNFKTRNELNIKKYIFKELHKINDIDKLNYIYLECFNERIIDNINIYSEIENKWDEVYLKIYDFLKKTVQKH